MTTPATPGPTALSRSEKFNAAFQGPPLNVPDTSQQRRTELVALLDRLTQAKAGLKAQRSYYEAQIKEVDELEKDLDQELNAARGEYASLDHLAGYKPPKASRLPRPGRSRPSTPQPAPASQPVAVVTSLPAGGTANPTARGRRLGGTPIRGTIQ